MRELTTIPITKDTRDALKRYGYKGETYDTIIKRLLMEVRNERITEP